MNRFERLRLLTSGACIGIILTLAATRIASASSPEVARLAWTGFGLAAMVSIAVVAAVLRRS